jgi:hypothetical protein
MNQMPRRPMTASEAAAMFLILATLKENSP